MANKTFNFSVRLSFFNHKYKVREEDGRWEDL